MRGLTLIETLMYLALFSMLMTGVIASLLQVKSGTERIEASARLTDEGHFLLERVRYGIEHASAARIDTDFRLVLTSTEIEAFEISDGVLMEVTAGGTLPLNPASTAINDWRAEVADTGEVRISFLLTVHTLSGSPVTSLFRGSFSPLNVP
ncbi:MAG TPA: hypothetical protein VJA87_00780 [Candidatus Paceibacterota bacterium]